MVRDVKEFHQVWPVIMTQSKNLQDLARLKVSIDDQKKDVILHETSERVLKDELARVTAESTRTRASSNCDCAQVVKLGVRLAAKEISF